MERPPLVAVKRCRSTGVAFSYDPCWNASSWHGLAGGATSRRMNQAIAALVRRHDPDRFLTALFAPPERRDALLTLYAFNHELARAREVVSEPPLALIRLQWWREVVEGAAPPPRGGRTAAHRDRGRRTRSRRPAGADRCARGRGGAGVRDAQDWRAYLFGSAGGVAVAAARLLGSPDAEGIATAWCRLWRCRSAAQHSDPCTPGSLPAARRHSGRAWIDARGRIAAPHAAACTGGDAATRPRRIDVASAASPATALHRRRAARRAGKARSRRTPISSLPRGLGDRLAVVLAGITRPHLTGRSESLLDLLGAGCHGLACGADVLTQTGSRIAGTEHCHGAGKNKR